MLTIIFNTGHSVQVKGNVFSENKIFFNKDFANGKPLDAATSHLIATLPVGANCIVVSSTELVAEKTNIDDAIHTIQRSKNITGDMLFKLEKIIEAKKLEAKS